jgi:phosphotransferase system HPr (HPr) family protein
VTFLTHFVERHESGVRSEAAEVRIEQLIDRADVQDVILNHLLFWADSLMQRGRTLAEELLPSYTNLQELVVEMGEDVRLHARPASLIVNIVGRYGTPVELEVGGKRCNAGSILELLVTIGAQPDARVFIFRGDENPLRDIGRLFEVGLGEDGIDGLPDDLAYLRPD